MRGTRRPRRPGGRRERGGRRPRRGGLARVGADPLEVVRLGNVVQLVAGGPPHRVTAAVRAARPPADDPAAAAACSRTELRPPASLSLWMPGHSLAPGAGRTPSAVCSSTSRPTLAARPMRTDRDYRGTRSRTWSRLARRDHGSRARRCGPRALASDAAALNGTGCSRVIGRRALWPAPSFAEHGVELTRPELDAALSFPARPDATSLWHADDDLVAAGPGRTRLLRGRGKAWRSAPTGCSGPAQPAAFGPVGLGLG